MKMPKYKFVALEDYTPRRLEYDCIYETKLTNKSLSFPGVGFEEARRLLADGRVGGLIMEKMVSTIFSESLMEAHKNSVYDFKEKGSETLLECKVITKHGVDPRPSNMKGQGRRHNEKLYVGQLNRLSYFIFVDIHLIGLLDSEPIVRIIPVPTNHKVLWRANGSPVSNISVKTIEKEFYKLEAP